MNALIEQARRRAAALTGLLAVRFPLLGADITAEANPALAAAVSQAGGLGVLDAIHLGGGAIEGAVRQIRSLTDRPFAVSLRVPPKQPVPDAQADRLGQALAGLRRELGIESARDSQQDFDAQFEAVLAARPVLAVFLNGGPREIYKEALEKAGILAAAGCTSLREAKVMRSAGCDILLAQGCEAAGPRWTMEGAAGTDPLGLMALVPQAARVFAGPVVACGAVMSAAAAAAALLMGASGVGVSALLAQCSESGLPEAGRERLRWSDGSDARLTAVWTGSPGRYLETGLQASLQEAQFPLPPWPAAESVMRPISRAAMQAGRLEAAAVPAGQNPAGAPRTPAGAVIAQLGEQLEAFLQS